VTARDFKERLSRRARKLHVPLPQEVIEPFETYFRLLTRWNAKINLTALPLEIPTDETFDRLFIEPLAAATFIDDAPGVWFDLGSGGGSPAFPLKMIRPALALTLVESKSRKAAFLREVVRTLKLTTTQVANVRVEDLEPAADRTAILVTVRAVRPDAALLAVAARLLREGGQLLLFGKLGPGHLSHSAFVERKSPSVSSRAAAGLVMSYTRVFHVEQ
jgi:16S rRNA (guanine527-N7)-methyltransferase